MKFNTSTHTTEGILDYVHSDLWGPARKTSFGGARYMMTIVDDYSRKVWPYFLKHKYQAFDVFKEWKTMVERQTERKVKILRTDNGMEFCSKIFKSYCKSKGIVRHYTVPHTPQHIFIIDYYDFLEEYKANVKYHRPDLIHHVSAATLMIHHIAKEGFTLDSIVSLSVPIFYQSSRWDLFLK